MNLPEFAESLRPIIRELRNIPLREAAAAQQTIESLLPFHGEAITSLRQHAIAAKDAGWLVPKVNGDIRFGRVAKDLDGFSVDAVLMSSPGPKHRHTNGEIDLCFTLAGTPKFDGHPEGWVVFPPESVHVPTVTGGEMLILYFLPGGGIEFL